MSDIHKSTKKHTTRNNNTIKIIPNISLSSFVFYKDSMYFLMENNIFKYMEAKENGKEKTVLERLTEVILE